MVKPQNRHETRSRFVTEADWIPSFWNFLLKLDRNDLVAELVQNDLDQGATRTVISFEEDRLVCQGNGSPVTPDGWQRLRKIQGAGDRVPAKRGKIGIKNHGLKTAFTIGDEIRLLSARLAITQTLYAHGRGEAPYPGASAEPEPDSDAPVGGCRIIIRYRDTDIEPREGEAIVLGAVTEEEIDALFRSACTNTPEQFAGVVSPEVAPRYEIVLQHWRLGEARFVFSCTRPRKVGKGIEVFRRRCAVSGTASTANGVHEEAARRFLPLKGRLKQRAADFFRRGNRFFVEVSWPVNGRGQPRLGVGRFRYPIGYPVESYEARTGHGAFFNAPIVSDTERHGPATNDATNKELTISCEELLVDTLAKHVIPRWRAHGLNPLIPGAESREEVVRRLLATLARKGAMPTLKWRDAVGVLLKGKIRKARVRRTAIQKNAAGRRRYRFIVPIATWAGQVDLSLSVISPKGELQLDPRTHPDIVGLLCDSNTEGFCKHFITFDERDAFAAITQGGNQYFKAVGDPTRELSDLLVAHSYLDVIDSALSNGKCDERTEDALKAAVFLPDAQLVARPFESLYISALLPSDVPGLPVPSILHEQLAGHEILRRSKWRRRRYRMATFLESGTLEDADEETRRLFWNWLRQNEGSMGPRERSRLAGIAIWPDADGHLGTLADLCEPSSSRVATILGDSIRRPHDHVRRSKLTVSGGRKRTSIRRVPTGGEIQGWLDRRKADFAMDVVADVEMVAALDRFEAELTTLLKHASTKRAVGVAEVDLPALALDGTVQERSKLVHPSRAIDRLALRERFLLKDKRRSQWLNSVTPALTAPTIEMVLVTLDEDAENIEALQARLQQFLDLTEPVSSEKIRLAQMPILPVNGRLRAPRELVFRGTHGDYWGDWKVQISGRGLSQDDQARYRAVGVTSALPSSGSSYAFFQWLSEQDTSVVERHVAPVLRHILHHNGPGQWGEEHPDMPFVPVGRHDGVRLVSLRMTRRQWVFLPDERKIADVVTERDPNILFAIDRVREVSRPISDSLRKLGIRSLREALGEPGHVSGSGDVVTAPERFGNVVSGLKSAKFRRTFFKRIDDLGIEAELVRRDWYDRVSRITSIRVADTVKARYRLRRRAYSVAVGAGFDPESGTFWMKREEQRIELSSLCEAIAAQLVFKATARPVELFALERALKLEIDDPSYGPRTRARSSLEQEEATVDDSVQDGDVEEGDEDSEPGEATAGHSPFRPDVSRNVPRPGPIPSSSGGGSQHSSRRGRRGNESRGGEEGARNTPPPTVERVQVEDLKVNQYASHCQMCLCRRTPEELAPAGSYIEWEEVRRRVVEAHHVDLKSAGGARHAGNLILLCKFHHDNYGRRLTRAAVASALLRDSEERMIRFGRSHEAADVEGQVVKMVLADTAEVVELFFTNEHASYWCSQARSSAGAKDAD